jgi:hypothetical protein
VTDLDRTLALYERIRPRITRAITNSATFLDGYPTGGNASGDGTSRTEALGLAHAYGNEKENGAMTGPNDAHGATRRQLERCIDQLADLVDQLAPSNKAADHLRTSASDACPDGCCQPCWRTGTRTPTKNPGGRMCRWCNDTARALDMDEPPHVLVDKHTRGVRITDRDVRMATGGKHGA